jgi:tRNA-Thr(GGU) m(6)t(6)A37 methyltransferase TsaA
MTPPGSPGPFELRPIGWVRSERSEVVDDGWDAVASTVVLDGGRFGPEALGGLDAFSHVEVYFVFDRVAEDAVETGSRHPRGRADWPEVGIFAQRAKDRPNRLGATTCRLVGVSGLEVRVVGLDAVDGTPVVDLKPYLRGFAPRGEVTEPAWAAELMAGYW